ncbi:MAG TPA: hypothetical protein VGP93_14180 [Polyangiaceae bacterium]|jgi:hypothetical protein|nr:hypothetical protein [Polyangiaceae bacterium]
MGGGGGTLARAAGAFADGDGPCVTQPSTESAELKARTPDRRTSGAATITWYHAALDRAALLLGLLASCGSVPQPKAEASRVEPPAAKPPRQTWPAFAEVSSWPALNAEPFPSRGHLLEPGFVDVRVSTAAREIYLGLVADNVFPEETILALFFTDRPRAHPGGVYAMEKRAGGWRFLGMDAQGGLDPHVDSASCARCHEVALADGAFGLPRSAPQPTSAPPAPGVSTAPPAAP